MIKRYETYKDSHSELLGKIPENWNKTKLKFVANAYGRIGYRGYTTKDIVPKGTGAVTISPSNIKENEMQFKSSTYISWEKYEESPEIKIFNDDILIVKTGSTYGKVGFVQNLNEKATINPQLLVLKDLQINPKYLFQLLRMPIMQKQVEMEVVGSTIPTISQTKVLNFEIPLPSSCEQIQIANYLDYKIELIDAIIAQKKHLIEKLKEQRQAIINEAVTNGLNPNASLKDSGIEWLGMIPEHWEVAKLKWLANIFSGGTPSTNIQSYWTTGTIPWLNSGTVNQKRITEASTYITEEALQNSSTKWVNKGSILMALAGQGKTKGMAAMLEFDATCNQSMAAIEIIETKAYNEFILIWLESNYLNIRSMGGGEKRDGINLQILGNIYCPLPSVEEQKEISKHVNNLASKIEISSEELIKSIKKLKEYRQSLISEAVTGKIDVRDWQPKTKQTV